jgi:hypothetical protein
MMPLIESAKKLKKSQAEGNGDEEEMPLTVTVVVGLAGTNIVPHLPIEDYQVRLGRTERWSDVQLRILAHAPEGWGDTYLRGDVNDKVNESANYVRDLMPELTKSDWKVFLVPYARKGPDWIQIFVKYIVEPSPLLSHPHITLRM